MVSDQHPARWSGGKRSVKAFASESEQPAAETTPAEPAEVELEPEPAAEPESAPEDEPVAEPAEPLATDAARELAFQYGIDLRDVTGTGAEGRITRDDVAALLPAPAE